MAGPSHDPSLYRDRDVVPVRRALVSVSDKTDLISLATALAEAGLTPIVSLSYELLADYCPAGWQQFANSGKKRNWTAIA